MRKVLLLITLMATTWYHASSYLRTNHIPHRLPLAMHATAASSSSSSTQLSPIFQLSSSSPTDPSPFERIDDVIMGGVSSSTFGPSKSSKDCWTFRGVLRNTGGGFCGFRTAAFSQPLSAVGYDGVYLKARFTSDDEPSRRTYKLTVRDDKSRGEYVRQAMFSVPCKPEGEIPTIRVPFEDLVAVRGPVKNPNAPAFNKTSVFQLGMVISKFKIAQSTETLEDFRDGPFSLDVSEIGFYTDANAPPAEPVARPSVSSEPKKSSPLAAIFKLIFSEKSRRRRAALLVLSDRPGRKKGLGRGWLRAVRLCYKSRASSYGMLSAVATFASRFAADAAKFAAGKALKYALFYPIFAAFRAVKFFRVKVLKQTVAPVMR